MDFRSRASSNFSSNIVPESGSTDFVEGLFRLEAETAADDLLLDLGGAAEDRRDQHRRHVDSRMTSVSCRSQPLSAAVDRRHCLP
jgi:hypothetical protein